MAETKETKKTERVVVEAVKRHGFSGFYCLERLFPNDTPVELEVGTEDLYKTRKITDPVTQEETEERYLFRKSDLSKLLDHGSFLKIYRQGQTQVGGAAPVPDKSQELTERRKAAIKTAEEEAQSSGDKGPTGTKR